MSKWTFLISLIILILIVLVFNRPAVPVLLWLILWSLLVYYENDLVQQAALGLMYYSFNQTTNLDDGTNQSGKTQPAQQSSVVSNKPSSSASPTAQSIAQNTGSQQNASTDGNNANNNDSNRNSDNDAIAAIIAADSIFGQPTF